MLDWGDFWATHNFWATDTGTFAHSYDPTCQGGARPTRITARWVLLRRDRRAVTALEYAVIAGVMVAIVMSATGPFALGLATLLNHIGNSP